MLDKPATKLTIADDMNDLVRFSFSLSPRMQAFLLLRDGLHCLDAAERTGQPYLWLQACIDLRASLLGDHGRKPAIPEVLSLFVTMRAHIEKLANDHPRFRESIDASCKRIDEHAETLRDGHEEAVRFLSQDAMIETYLNAQKKQDWLGHKPCLPQGLAALWSESEDRQRQVHEQLGDLASAAYFLDVMLQDYVMWEKRTAYEGCDQITPERGTHFGLVIIGLDPTDAGLGIVPDISGNRLAIRLRFQQWDAGQPASQVLDDVPYSMMLVPIA